MSAAIGTFVLLIVSCSGQRTPAAAPFIADSNQVYAGLLDYWADTGRPQPLVIGSMTYSVPPPADSIVVLGLPARRPELTPQLAAALLERLRERVPLDIAHLAPDNLAVVHETIEYTPEFREWLFRTHGVHWWMELSGVAFDAAERSAAVMTHDHGTLLYILVFRDGRWVVVRRYILTVP